VTGYSLDNDDPNSNFVLTGLKDRMTHIIGDIRDTDSLKKAFEVARPDAVLHLAAQPIVKHAFTDPRYTYDVNVMGTLNVLEQIKASDTCGAGIIITSDKCYDNVEWVWGYRENDRLGGNDIYSSSKGCAEIVVNAYRHSFPAHFGHGGKILTTARAGNVIGGGDWGDYRIVPDCIRALSAGKAIVLRHPQAVRPWQHVLEPLFGYLMLLQRALEKDESIASGWNFGPHPDSAITVEQLVCKVIDAWCGGEYTCEKPDGTPEANMLSLDTCKARRYLGWTPVWDIDTAVDKTVSWYKNSADTDVAALCLSQIEAYMQAMR
jgi:CDP-glucose 4,6-dehydratase